jgi:predicted aspartyl protease
MIRNFLYIFILINLLFSNIGISQVPGFYMKEESRKLELFFLGSNNLIIVPVSINGSVPINFLLDTGVKTNILFSKTIGETIGMTFTRKLDLVGADGTTVLTASVSPNNQMDLGNIEGKFQTVLVLDEDFFELEKVIGVPVYGVIGYEFFKYNPVKIDYDKSVITFYKSDALKWKPFGYRKIPMSVDNSKPYINGKVDQFSGEEFIAKLLIDTGANHGLLLNLETSDKIKLPPKYIKSDLGRSLGGDLFGFIGRVKQLSLSGLKFRNVITSYPEETEFSYVVQETGRQGSLGAEIFGRTKIILDYRRERLLIRRGQNFSNPFEHNMSGITPKMFPTDEKRYYVSKVREDSPGFVSGVRENDEIMSINNIPVDFWELSDLIKLFRSEEGREIILELKRIDEQNPEEPFLLTVQFQLQRQI